MSTKRRVYSAEFKARVALEALQERETLAVLGSRHGVHPAVVGQWKKAAREGLAGVLGDRRAKVRAADAKLVARLYEEIGRLKMEVEFLKKTH